MDAASPAARGKDMTPKTIPEIVDLASAFYGSAVLFVALDLGVFKALAEQGGSADRDALA